MDLTVVIADILLFNIGSVLIPGMYFWFLEIPAGGIANVEVDSVLEAVVVSSLTTSVWFILNSSRMKIKVGKRYKV